MKILLLGAGGLLGRHLATELRHHDLTALTHADADITHAPRLDQLFTTPWDAVINAAAIVNFDACENDPAGTDPTNLHAPLDLARRCHATGATFVQFTSDYIFPGTLQRPLEESDTPAPLSVYGRQKAALEHRIPAICPRSLLLRLSWLYGTGGRTFMSLIPRILADNTSLRIAAGKTGSCLLASDAAHWIHQLVAQRHTGLFNLVNKGTTSWEHFARTCLEKINALGLSPACREIIEVPFQSLGIHGAKRPTHSTLSTAKLAATLPPGPRPWEAALDDFLATTFPPAHHPAD